jgi:hypothetical protein
VRGGFHIFFYFFSRGETGTDHTPRTTQYPHFLRVPKRRGGCTAWVFVGLFKYVCTLYGLSPLLSSRSRRRLYCLHLFTGTILNSAALQACVRARGFRGTGRMTELRRPQHPSRERLVTAAVPEPRTGAVAGSAPRDQIEIRSRSNREQIEIRSRAARRPPLHCVASPGW